MALQMGVELRYTPSSLPATTSDSPSDTRRLLHEKEGDGALKREARARRKHFAVMFVAILIALFAVLVFVRHGSTVLQAVQALPEFVRAQDQSTLLLIILAMPFLDAVPFAGHMVVKSVQLTLPFVFTLPTAFALLLCSIFASCMVAFYIGRRLLQAPVRRLVAGHAWSRALDDAMLHDSGLRLAVLFRLAPLPEVLASYLLSVSAVRWSHYVVASMVEAFKSTLIVRNLSNPRALPARTASRQWDSRSSCFTRPTSARALALAISLSRRSISIST